MISCHLLISGCQRVYAAWQWKRPERPEVRFMVCSLVAAQQTLQIAAFLLSKVSIWGQRIVPAWSTSNA